MTREEQLKKWKEEKMLKKQIESKSKKPPFIVGYATTQSQRLLQTNLGSSVMKKDSFTSAKPKAAFTSKVQTSTKQDYVSKIPRALPSKMYSNTQQVPSEMKESVLKKRSTIRTCNAVKKLGIVGKKQVSKVAVEPTLDKNTKNANPVARPSFAPANFVFSPPKSISERFEEVFKAHRISTPIKGGRKSERLQTFKGGKTYTLWEESAIFSDKISNAKQIEKSAVLCSETQVDKHCGPEFSTALESCQFTAPHSHRLPKINEYCIGDNSADVDSENETKMHNCAVKHKTCDSRRSIRVQHKISENEPAADKNCIVDYSEQVVKVKSAQERSARNPYTPRHRTNTNFSIDCDETELSVFRNSPAVDIKTTPVSRAQKTRLTEEFEKLSLQSVLGTKQAASSKSAERQPLAELNKDFEPSLLYTPIHPSRRSVINIKGDMILFSPDV